MAPPQLFSWPQTSEYREPRQQILLSPPSAGPVEVFWTERGEPRREAALGLQLKQFGKAERYDLTRFALIYFSSPEKKRNPQCLTLQTNHTDFGYKAYCKFAPFRVSLLVNFGRQLSSQRWKKRRRADLCP